MSKTKPRNPSGRGRKTVGIYEAKAQLSKLIRTVRRHNVTIQISERGKPVALLSPLAESGSLDEHLEGLIQADILSQPAHILEDLKPIDVKPGALARFLSDRD